MSEVTNDVILEALKGVNDPISGKDVVSAGIIQGLQTLDGNVAFAIEVPAEKGAEMEPLRKQAEDTVFALPRCRFCNGCYLQLSGHQAPPQPPPQSGQQTKPGAPVSPSRPGRSASRRKINYCCSVW